METNIERGIAMERGPSVSNRRSDDRRHVLERELYNVNMFGERYITYRYLDNVEGIVQRQSVKGKGMKRSVNERPDTMNRVPNIDGEDPHREPRGMKRGFEGLNHTMDRDFYERQSYMGYWSDESASRAGQNERVERSRKRKVLNSRAEDVRDARYGYDIGVRERRRWMEKTQRVSRGQDHDMVGREEINDHGMRKRFSDRRPSYDQDKKNTGLSNDKNISQSMSGLQRHSLTKETSHNKQKHQKKSNKLNSAERKPISVKEKIEHLIAEMKKVFTPKRLSETGFAGFFNFGTIKSQISLMKHFDCKQFHRVGNGKMATHWLFIGNIFLARVFGTDKGDNKKECYEKAITVLLSKPVEEILQQEDPGVDSKADELLSNYENMPPEDDEMEDLAEKKEKFKALRQSIKLLVDNLNPHNTSRQEVVMYLEMAFKESRCDLGYNYSDAEVTWFNGMPWFIGIFELEGIPIAAASGSCRDSTKKNTFEEAIKFLHGNSLYVVTEGICVDRRELMPAIEKVTEQIDLPTLKSRNKLNTFLGKLKENRKKETEPRTRIKECAKNLCLSVLVVDRRNPPAGKNIESVLYLDNILITSSGNSRLGKRNLLYKKALKVLLSTSADDIYNDFKRLSPEDVHGVFQADEMTRDLQLLSHYSNNYTAVKWEPPTFKMSNSDNLNDLPTDRDNIILFEKAEWAADRYDNSLMILRFIAMMNCMPFHINVIHDECVNKFRVRLFILHEFVSEAVHSSKEAAKKQAAASYLFQLYQTKPTIMIRPEDDIRRLVTFEAMKDLAANLKEESGSIGPEEEDGVMMTYKEMKQANSHEEPDKDPDESPDGDQNNQPALVRINTWIGKAAECLIEEHFSRETLETLTFSQGFPSGYFAYIRMLAHKHGHVTKKVKTWLVVNHRYPLSKTLEILTKHNGQSGKYTIIPKSDLPRPCDLELLAQENDAKY